MTKIISSRMLGVGKHICSECKQKHHRRRTTLELVRGRSAVDRSHQATNRSTRRKQVTLTLQIDIYHTEV
jgi:hypothetical protein